MSEHGAARDAAWLAECRALQRAVAPHATLAALESAPEWPALRARLDALLARVHRHAPAREPAPAADAHAVRLVQWNVEHGNRHAAVAHALATHPRLAGADVLTLPEVDLGCARSGNRDVAAELASALGLHAAWAPLFLETTRGRDDDHAAAGERANEEGLFGIAVLARWPLGDVRIVELPSPRALQFGRERMLGRHVALVAEVLRPGAPFVAVAVHLEVHRLRAHRTAQVRVLLEALAHESRPVVIAGDLNTHTFDRGRWHSAATGALVLALTPAPLLRARLLRPDRGRAREPLFDALHDAGFAWEAWNDFAPTLQLRDERLPEVRALPALVRAPLARALAWAVRRGALRLDWIVARGWRGGRGETVSGLDGPGGASDHAPIVATLQG